MGNLDCLLSIAIHADFNKTLLLAQTCSYIHKNVWKLKLKYYFPGKKYFDFWTGSKNYLVQSRKIFTLVVDFNIQTVGKTIYEYDPILCDVIYESFNFDYEERIELVKFNVKRRFVLMREDNNFTATLIGQYDSKKRALISAKKNQEIYLNDGLDIDEKESFSYALVDLKYITPKFFKIQNKNMNRNITYRKYYTFYRGEYNKPIKF